MISMSFSVPWMWISLFLLVFFVVLFFVNQKPKFLLPMHYLKKKLWFFYIFLVAISVGSVILLPLQLSFVSDKQVVINKNIPIQILFDVSLSMSSTDIQPSRFSAAKTSLISLIHQLDGYAISLIAFSWKPFISIPFSTSSPAIISKLTSLNLGDFPPVKDFLWTALWDAMLLAVQNLQQFSQQKTYTPWIVVLMTDGDSNVWFDPTQIIDYYQKLHMPLFVLGVGQENYLIGRDTWDDSVMTDINIDLLQHLADKTWGKFYRVLGNTSFDQFLSDFYQHIVAQQQPMIKNIFWKLNDVLLYILVVALFGLLGFLSLSLWSTNKNTLWKFEK